MLIKDCDSREYDLLVLEVLAQDAALAAPERHKVLEALRAIRARQARRRALASQLDTLLGTRDDWVVLHDVRLAQAEGVIEIDHLLINSLMQVWVLDASCFDLTLSITPFGELLAHDGRVAQEGEVPADEDGVMAHAVTPCPLQTIPERSRAIVQWLEASSLLPVRLGMTLQPQLRYRIVVADAAQVSRPPEDIFDSRALLSFARLKRQCLQVSSKTAYVTRLRSFTHRLDQRRLRQLGRAIATRHVAPNTDWVAELGLATDTRSPEGGGATPVSTLAYLWQPPLSPEGQSRISGESAAMVAESDDMEGASEDTTLAVQRGVTSTAALKRQCGFGGRGLQAAHWQPGHQDPGQGSQEGSASQQGAGEQQGTAPDHQQGVSSARSQDEEGLPRCQGCRRWLSSQSVDFCRQAEQARALGGRLLCKRCRDASAQ
ncbi:nuclease-related domain-containing protein [Cobetia sp. LC6]|uniref:nuclease-related domain-containing protein n=1 Tax=Cobetia sp. LC6 TaxID=3050947 RepID=UPI0025545CD0|nr:nuclease-related domain-containing protein [Cobetia sp. LC6]MDL2191742.1 nuclease-related domain-containing protein [Cobetia sp. LC6]